MTVRRRRRVWQATLVSVAAAGLGAGCWYDSFEFGQDEPGEGTGGSGNSGTGGSDNPNTGGNAGSPSADGGQGQGGMQPPDPLPPLVLQDKTFTLRQSEALDLPAGTLFTPEAEQEIEIVGQDTADPLRPAAYDATFTIGEDGRFSFTPHEDYWGTYRIQYTVQDNHAQQATATITVRVRPVDVKLEAVAAGLNGFVIDGVAEDRLGAALAGAGDFDGDGRADVLIGAPGPDIDDSVGRAFVVYGKATTSLVDLDGDEERFVVFSGAGLSADNPRVGYSVSGAGDLDDDGFGDIIIGAPGSPGANGKGRAFVLFGGELTGIIDLSDVDGYGYAITGGDLDGVGRVVGGGHDINGDGVPDLLVSSNDVATTYKGSLHAVFGPGTAGALSALSDLHIAGETNDKRLPHTAAAVGDIDGDGRSEVLLSTYNVFALVKGAGGASPSWPAQPALMPESGSADTVSGWRLPRGSSLESQCTHLEVNHRCGFVAAAGDVNGDGKRDVALCNGNNACRVVLGVPSSLTADWQLTGFPNNSQPRVAGDGDLNGDGRSDLLFAVNDRGYVVFGKASPSDSFNVTTVDGNTGFAIAPEADANLSTVALVGDVNGDGIDDFALGAPEHDSGAGRVYVIFGMP